MLRFLFFFLSLSITVFSQQSYPDHNLKSKHPSPLLVFTAMGCGPYNANGATAISRYIELENKEKSSQFIIHLGDIFKGTEAAAMSKESDFGESRYSAIRKLLLTNNSIPTFILPGDNEITDQKDVGKAISFWEKNFLLFDDNFKKSWEVNRQEKRKEHFSFKINDVLLIGIHKVGGKVRENEYWQNTLKDSTEWLSESFSKNKDVKAAVIFTHAPPKGKDDAKKIYELVKKFSKPVVYIHANGHKWTYKPEEGPENFCRLQLDLIHSRNLTDKAPYYPPIQISVTGDDKEPFIYNRRLHDKKWIKAGDVK